MQPRMAWLLGALVLGSAGWAALSVSRKPTQVPHKPAAVATPKAAAALNHAPGPTALEPRVRASLVEAAAWLARSSDTHAADKSDDLGRQQANVALAMARVARLTGRASQAALARQRIHALLHACTQRTPDGRLPAAAPLLVLAMLEVPTPDQQALDLADELCRCFAEQQRPNGAFANTEDHNEAVGDMLQALGRSYRHRPADWISTVLRRACDYYLPYWRTHQNMASLPAQVQAYAEAYRWTSAACFVTAVTEMSDWMCRQQYTKLDPQHPDWLGGFRDGTDGERQAPAPTLRTAAYAEALAAACVVARRSGDLVRYRQYRTALERSLGFILTLQYTAEASQSFAEWYRPVLRGGFCWSHEDGSLRLDDACHALGAMSRYLQEVAHTRVGSQKANGRADFLRVYYLLSAVFFDSGRRPVGSHAVVDVS